LPFPIVSSGRHPNETRGGRRKKRMERCTRSGSRTQYRDPIRMLQADGFTGGVPLTDRISGGSLISKTEGAAEPSPCRRSGRLPRRQPVRLVFNNKERDWRPNKPTNNVNLFHRQRLPPLYIPLHSLQPTRHAYSECVVDTSSSSSCPVNT
jgi:hypothetical protein